MSEGACTACLRRSGLIGLLSGRITGELGRRDNRIPGLLALEEGELIAALAGGRAQEAYRYLEGFDAAPVRAGLTGRGIRTLCAHAVGFPPELRFLDDPPAVLYCAGDPDRTLALLEGPAVAIVGTRRASPYGLEVARGLGHGLSAAGVTVVSGLALGIDAAAHRGALEAGSAAVAVLASGADVAYPRRHGSLHREIVARGAVLSELPPGHLPHRWSFPARNRIMAGLAQVTVVVEAAESSGSLITADFAADLGRIVAAVPGRVTAKYSAGSNRLLADGASLVGCAEDVLDLVFAAGGRPAAALAAPPVLEPHLRAVLDAVEAGEGADGIGAACELGPGAVRAALGRLETIGLVRRDGLGGYQRTAERREAPVLG